MKQMSLIEMDGFLKGKCIPSDLKVNETNAEYLVRKFAEAEAKISALSEDHQKAIESIKQADSAVKLAHEKFSALAAENELARKAVQAFCDVVGDNTEVIAEEVGRDGVLVILGAMKATGNMPATAVFLAEVRAQGVEMYADNLDNAADDAERGGFDYAVKFLRSEASGVRLFADQLRKGGNQ
ncbi:ead/Ea22-like family protein [Escherichia coli]|uniref:ead/Ea22-like family protein n=1 Tax=Escherichia coli TaxID=562 RepID=UPI00285BC9DD|nr:ead/Ea22-like family protein [Escherichia coli]MDU9450573.1 ead/Ea22-like family protein [Escherichia coli]UGE35713.1 ead/Ea22-like family protein [Escherichia coli]UGE59334.1 ead/Ea22-like family protein [Escherichia coli]HDW0468373.1 ead/Ea22-like family protein [Escherichia coli]HDW1105684.1 ead/Ea22-like family protein [Escherichia coli]